MRLSLVTFASLAAALLFTGIAAAQEAPGTQHGSGSSDATTEDPDEAQSYAARKAWSVSASFESGRTFLQEDVGGNNKAHNNLSLSAAYAITPQDRVSVNGGFIQGFVADPTETGIRADDIGLTYAHTFKLPWQLNLGASAGNEFPVSLYSQRMSLIALPRAGLNLSRNFWNNNLNVSLHGNANYYIVKYKEADSPDDDQGLSGPNTQFSTSIGFNVNLAMPFHPAWSVGGGASTAWSWSYDPSHANDPTLAAQFKNAPVDVSADPYFHRQLGQESYGWQGYMAYNLPSIKDVHSDFQVTASQSDGVLRDGATHLYWLSRRGGQISASLTVSY